MPASPRRRPLRLKCPKAETESDFRDSESQRTIRALSLAWARAMGREAANEYFDQLINARKKVS
jgi:hypothetical protein